LSRRFGIGTSNENDGQRSEQRKRTSLNVAKVCFSGCGWGRRRLRLWIGSGRLDPW
jgi:hypothetical protein